MRQNLLDRLAELGALASQDLAVLAGWLSTAALGLMAWLGTLLVVVFVGSGVLLVALGEYFFDTSILDEEPHEQKTTGEEQGYFEEPVR